MVQPSNGSSGRMMTDEEQASFVRKKPTMKLDTPINRVLRKIDGYCRTVSNAISSITGNRQKLKHEKKDKRHRNFTPIKFTMKRFLYLLLLICVSVYPFIDFLVDFSEPPTECLERANLKDCGGISHYALFILFFFIIFLFGLTLKNFYLRMLAQDICKVIVIIIICGYISRNIFRVTPHQHIAEIKGAYVLNMDRCVKKWQRMELMLSSFPEGVVQRSSSKRWIGRFGFSNTKFSVSMAHIMALETISKREQIPSTSGKDVKDWYLVFEDDATTELDVGTLYESLNTMLGQVPIEAEAVNLGPSKARLRLFDVRWNCRFFGYDPTTLLSILISVPHHISNEIVIKHHKNKEFLNAGNELYVYRGFGTCRQAYAVTPAGARWMMASVLRSMIIDGWGSGGGDSIIATASIRDMFTHQTFFMRIFEQDEWCDPSNAYACHPFEGATGRKRRTLISEKNSENLSFLETIPKIGTSSSLASSSSLSTSSLSSQLTEGV